MDEFIMIIVKHMNTLDGHKDSAEPFKVKQKLTKQHKYPLIRSTVLKYKLMRIRCKISFMAMLQMKTIPELIISQIKNTYYDLVKLKEIKVPAENLIIEDDEIIKCLTSQGWKSIIILLQTINAEELLVK